MPVHLVANAFPNGMGRKCLNCQFGYITEAYKQEPKPQGTWVINPAARSKMW